MEHGIFKCLKQTYRYVLSEVCCFKNCVPSFTHSKRRGIGISERGRKNGKDKQLFLYKNQGGKLIFVNDNIWHIYSYKGSGII